MTKGSETKTAILDAGLNMAGKLGLEGVSIGVLAKSTNMSKSGLFAHFKSKENLQIELLNYAGHLFSDNVLLPALKLDAGNKRIRSIVDNWIKWDDKLTGGCIFVSASAEYSDRPGKVRDFLLQQQDDWINCLSRIGESAVKAGYFKEDADCKQFAFDLYSLLLGFHLYDKLLQERKTRDRQENALNRLLDFYRK